MARRLPRVATALATATVCTRVILRVTGLLPGLRPVGAADNSDGFRLYRGAGLVADLPDERAGWKPGVLLDFTRTEPAADPMPSAALPVMRAAAHGFPRRWSLTRLGRTYATLAGVLAGAATWAATADDLAGALALVPALLPLADRDFARFFLSTYSEPAGLLGAAALLAGTAVVAVNRRRAGRGQGLALAGGGGLLAVTAKLGFAPLLPIGAAVCATTGGPAGGVAGAATLLAAIRPVVAALRWHARFYPRVNTHNLVFTLLLPQFGQPAAVAVGLPPAALAHAGRGSSDDEGWGTDYDQIPGWQATIGADEKRVRRAALRFLVRQPRQLARVVGVAMQATRGRDLAYLPDIPLAAGYDGPMAVPDTGATGHSPVALRAWLDAMPAPWWPSLLAATGAVAGVAGSGSRDDLVRALCRVAGVGAAAAVGIAVSAVLGDGYYELAKHVWLSGYLLDVTGLALLGAILVVLSRSLS
jgi:hypothetical protein